MNRGQVIGADGGIPWHFPEDLKNFDDTVKNHVIICGRKTFQSMPKKYHNRNTVVLTRSEWLMNCTKASNMFQAVAKARNLLEAQNKPSEIFIVGGASVYEEAVGMAHEMILTYVYNDFMGDVLFPEIQYGKWTASKVKTFDFGKIIYWKRK